jgi:hypothetical protein
VVCGVCGAKIEAHVPEHVGQLVVGFVAILEACTQSEETVPFPVAAREEAFHSRLS